MTQDEAIRKAAEEIGEKYLWEPCREVDDNGDVCAWVINKQDEQDILDIIRKHLKGEGCNGQIGMAGAFVKGRIG